jgi:uncharacterized protein YcbK (DUF882 family)
MQYFKSSEFDCKHTGKNEMNLDFLQYMDELRERCGFPLVITSGYRDVTHPVEAKKDKPGFHSKGVAADVSATTGDLKYIIVNQAMEMGFYGIGVHRAFIHLDCRQLIYPEMPKVVFAY